MRKGFTRKPQGDERATPVKNLSLIHICTWSGEEGLCYLLGGQPAHLAQGERNARFRR